MEKLSVSIPHSAPPHQNQGQQPGSSTYAGQTTSHWSAPYGSRFQLLSVPHSHNQQVVGSFHSTVPVQYPYTGTRSPLGHTQYQPQPCGYPSPEAVPLLRMPAPPDTSHLDEAELNQLKMAYAANQQALVTIMQRRYQEQIELYLTKTQLFSLRQQYQKLYEEKGIIEAQVAELNQQLAEKNQRLASQSNVSVTPSLSADNASVSADNTDVNVNVSDTPATSPKLVKPNTVYEVTYPKNRVAVNPDKKPLQTELLSYCYDTEDGRQSFELTSLVARSLDAFSTQCGIPNTTVAAAKDNHPDDIFSATFETLNKTLEQGIPPASRGRALKFTWRRIIQAAIKTDRLNSNPGLHAFAKYLGIKIEHQINSVEQ